jgi:hypothetical protein
MQLPGNESLMRASVFTCAVSGFAIVGSIATGAISAQRSILDQEVPPHHG